MSRSVHETVACPNCGAKQRIRIWPSVNVTVDPKLKELFLGKVMHTLRCKSCKGVSLVSYNCLYHDMNKKFMVRLRVQPDDDDDKSGAAMITKYMRDYDLRIVDSLNEMLEKVRVCDDGHDDRIIELLKHVLREQAGLKNDAALYYAEMMSNDNGQRQLVFVHLGEDGEDRFETPFDTAISESRAEMARVGMQPHPEKGKWLLVNNKTVCADVAPQKTAKSTASQPAKSTEPAETVRLSSQGIGDRVALSVVKLLQWLACSDGPLTKGERDVITVAGKNMGLFMNGPDIEDRPIVDTRLLRQACEAVRNLNDPQTRWFMETCIRLAVVDGDLSAPENHILRLIADVNRYPDGQFERQFQNTTGKRFCLPGDSSSIDYWEARVADSMEDDCVRTTEASTVVPDRGAALPDPADQARLLEMLGLKEQRRKSSI